MRLKCAHAACVTSVNVKHVLCIVHFEVHALCTSLRKRRILFAAYEKTGALGLGRAPAHGDGVHAARRGTWQALLCMHKHQKGPLNNPLKIILKIWPKMLKIQKVQTSEK